MWVGDGRASDRSRLIKSTGMGSRKPEILFRYTSLPVLLHMLQSRQITLLSPETWEDRNDAYYLDQYRQKKILAVSWRFVSPKAESDSTSGASFQVDRPEYA